jgi:hypothetical protein
MKEKVGSDEEQIFEAFVDGDPVGGVFGWVLGDTGGGVGLSVFL